MHIEYLTSNHNKFLEAKHILAFWELTQLDIELSEIQGNAHEVIEAKAKTAYEILQRPLIVEDVSLCCPAIGGLPGPYIKDFLNHIGAKGLYELIHKYEDHSVQVTCLVAYVDAVGELRIFEGTQRGKIVAPRVAYQTSAHGWNSIVQPEGQPKTYAEMTLEERSRMSMRYVALKQLDSFLKEKLGRDVNES